MEQIASKNPRIEVVDALRGFAVMAIANITATKIIAIKPINFCFLLSFFIVLIFLLYIYLRECCQ